MLNSIDIYLNTLKACRAWGYKILKFKERLTDINHKVYEAASGLKLLSYLSWPVAEQDNFIRAYQKGQKYLPRVQYQKPKYIEQKAELKKLLASFTPDHPLETFTQKTILSYLDGIELAESVGTKSFTELSEKIFGQPKDLIYNSKISNVKAAENIISLSDDFNHSFLNQKNESIDASEIKAYLDLRIEKVFKGKGPEVIITDNLAAKATATSKRIKLRSGVHFSQYDFKQLFYHEVMTHALTAINGESQILMKSMARGSLRTLKTQEGLATFSEIITGAIDLHRLKRLALRVIAIDHALNGASFNDVFEFFVQKGQSLEESYLSTQRIFRGGYPDKNIVFTKDCIYLDGLMNVHGLFRWAMKNNRLELSHLLFCGRVSLEDLFDLEEAYKLGHISAPSYLPSWYSKIEGLAGSLSFSILSNIIQIENNQGHLTKVS